LNLKLRPVRGSLFQLEPAWDEGGPVLRSLYMPELTWDEGGPVLRSLYMPELTWGEGGGLENRDREVHENDFAAFFT